MQRASWERLPTPAEQYASGGWQQPPSPQQPAPAQWPPPARALTPTAAQGRRASHSRNSSWAGTWLLGGFAGSGSSGHVRLLALTAHPGFDLHACLPACWVGAQLSIVVNVWATPYADVTPRKPMDGKAMVLHDFQAADDQELTVFKDQEVGDRGHSCIAQRVHST